MGELMIGKIFKWIVGLSIVAYVVVSLFFKVLIADRKRPVDPGFMKYLENTQVELEECKESSEELRAKLKTCEEAASDSPAPADESDAPQEPSGPVEGPSLGEIPKGP